MQRLDATVIILVRHAEKASSATNTNLDPDSANTGIGVSRAQVLSGITANAGVSAIYATQWCRTAQTGQPSAGQLGLTMNILRSSHPSAGLDDCDPAITVSTSLLPLQVTSSNDLAQHVLVNHAGEVVLVVGHSNTVPQLVEAFGAPSVCPEYLPLSNSNTCLIPEEEYNHLFIVTVPHAGVPASVVHDTYGVQ
jgi:broad specificity phosphatase PhoE